MEGKKKRQGLKNWAMSGTVVVVVIGIVSESRQRVHRRKDNRGKLIERASSGI